MSVVCIRRPHTTWTTCGCEPCTRDRHRLTKLHRNGLYRRVPSEAAHATIERLRARGWTAHAIASATGLHFRTVDSKRREKYSPTVAARIVNHGDPTEGSVGADGTRRRLQGLARPGYDLRTISEAVGIGYSTLAAIRNSPTERVRARFYLAIRDYADAVGMKLGPSEPARKHAERMGWVGLLAWDDIDDPAETIAPPADDFHARRRAVLEDIADRGGNLTEAERYLGTDRRALQKWAVRNGARELYLTLARREQMVGNQWTREAS